MSFQRHYSGPTAERFKFDIFKFCSRELISLCWMHLTRFVLFCFWKLNRVICLKTNNLDSIHIWHAFQCYWQQSYCFSETCEYIGKPNHKKYIFKQQTARYFACIKHEGIIVNRLIIGRLIDRIRANIESFKYSSIYLLMRAAWLFIHKKITFTLLPI